MKAPIDTSMHLGDNHEDGVRFQNSRNGRNGNTENGINGNSGNSAQKVFDQMSLDKLLNNKGTVREYYDRFNLLFGGKGYNEGFLVDLFIWRLRPDIKKGISLFTLNSLSEAYHLAKFQESVYNITSLSSSSKMDHSKEVKKDSIELGFSDDGKGDRNEIKRVVSFGEILDGAKGGQMNESNVGSLDDGSDMCALEVEKKSEDGEDIESISSKENGDNDGGVILDNNLEGDINEEGEISIGNNKMTGNSLSVSSLFQSSYDLHKSLTPSSEETFSNGLITEDDNIAASSVFLTPFFEENKVLLKLVERDKGNDNMESQDKMENNGVTEDVKRRGLNNLHSGYEDINISFRNNENSDCVVLDVDQPFESLSTIQASVRKYCELLDVYQRMKYSKKESEGFMQVVSRVRSRSSVSVRKDTSNIEILTHGMEFRIGMSDLDEKSLLMHFKGDKKNGNSLGYWTFHIWNWPKRKKNCVTIDIWKWPRKKKACQTNYKLKYRGWKFDIWKWPDRKKNLVDSLLLARRQVLDGVKASLLHQFAHLVTLMEDKLSISIFKEIHGQDLLETWIEQDVESLNKWKGLMVYVAVQESHGCVDKATWELFMFGFDYGKSNFLKRDGMRSVWLKISTNMEGVCFDSSSNARTDGDHCKVMNYNELRYYTMWLMTDVCCITDSNDSRGQESFQGRWNDTNRFVSVGHVMTKILDERIEQDD
ncbi:hypothetical protein Tco_1153897 [Tanacetum coccineum]